MRDHALNKRPSPPFPFLISCRLCTYSYIPPDKLVDLYIEATRITLIATIKYVANPLYELRAGPATPLEVSPHLSVEPMQVEGPGENTKRIAHAALGVQLHLSLYRSC